MKTLLVLIASLLVSPAFASSGLVETPLKAEKITVERIKCPPGKKCAAVMRYELVATYQARGCRDKVELTITEDGETNDGKLILNLYAVNYHNPKLPRVLCIAKPMRTFREYVGGYSKERLKIIQRTTKPSNLLFW